MNANLILFIVILILVTGDKLTTYYSIKNLQLNNPNVDYLQAEKNILARFFMQRFGLLWGNVLFALVSVGLFYIALRGIQISLQALNVTNYIGISWYIMIIIYVITIGNNLYFVLKHAKVLP